MTIKLLTCENCNACTKVRRHDKEKFLCWGVSEPFEIFDLNQKCKAYPGTPLTSEGHWKDYTSPKGAETEVNLSQEPWKWTGIIKLLENYGFKSTQDVEEYLYKDKSEWGKTVEIMKNRPEYKQFQRDLEQEGFFFDTGLGEPDFGEIYKRYYAQKKTIEQLQKIMEEK